MRMHNPPHPGEIIRTLCLKPLGVERQTPADHAHMRRHLQPAVDRFKGLEDEDERREFHERLSAYVQVYSFLSQIIPYALIEDLIIERMTENDEIVTRYMEDRDFQGSAFPILAREIFESVRAAAATD